MKDPFNEGPAGAKARRKRSLAIALGLVAFIALVFGTTMLRLDQNRRDAAEATAAGRVTP